MKEAESPYQYPHLLEVKNDFDKINPTKIRNNDIRRTKKVLSQKTGIWKKVELTVSENEAEAKKEKMNNKERTQKPKKVETPAKKEQTRKPEKIKAKVEKEQIQKSKKVEAKVEKNKKPLGDVESKTIVGMVRSSILEHPTVLTKP